MDEPLNEPLQKYELTLKILEKTSLKEQYLQVFTDNYIDDEALKVLDDEGLLQLIPIVGHRMKIKAALKECKLLNESLLNNSAFQDLFDSEDINKNCLSESQIITFEVEEKASLVCNSVSQMNNADAGSSTQEEGRITESLESIKNLTNCSNSSSSDGRAILAEGRRAEGLLKESERKRLSQIIILHLLEKNPSRAISTCEFQKFAAQIQELFKQENSVVYYSPYEPATGIKGHKKNTSGKLYESYISRRRKLRSRGELPGTSRSSSTSRSTCTDTTETVSNTGSDSDLLVTATLPPQRPWIPLTRPNRTRPTCIFTVMCYNVLCDKYATRQMYGYCPSWALEWDYRKKGILDEIRHYSADIISLQEVETDQFYNFFLPELKQDGYDGIFSPKSRAKTMSESERKYVDGCAIFFRSAKFALVKEHLIEFNQLAMANSEGSDNMLNRVMPKDNIGLAALLKTKEAAWENGIPTDSTMLGQPILVCTAHIHWDPEFCDVKLIQTMMLSNELRSILDDSARTLRLAGQRDNVQLLLCGDFNSLPDSGVVEFLSAGRVSSEHRDFKELGYAGSLRRMPGSEHEFTHNFKLASAYSEDIMPYTNYTYDFKGIIDYIFYSKQSMTPLGLLGPLSQDWFREHKVVGCPHPHIPSDHFPLLVELEMSPSTSNSNGLIGRR